MAASGVDAGGPVLLRRLGRGTAVENVVAALAGKDAPFVLESTAPHQSHGRFTILGSDPVESFTFDGKTTGDWIDLLYRRIGPGDPRFSAAGLPFAGGWVGHLTYEAGCRLESIPCTHPNDIAIPLVHFALYDTVASYDHQDSCWFIAAIDWLDSPLKKRPSANRRLDALESLIGNAPDLPDVDWSKPLADDPTANMTQPDYFRRVAAAKRYIEAGDIYQVNLTQRFSAPTIASPFDLYRRLRRSNPGAMSALLIHGTSAVISSSPELFLDLSDRQILTRPIKGTRPRVGDAVLDAVRSRELLNSEKDRAELTMIVDLMRNDLGKVSEFGTVRVESPAQLETHPTVFHLVATISGTLRQDRTWADLLRASCPGGSITGTPKIRAMQIIDELEPTERSVYCGSIGYIGMDGSMRLNIAIRTMVLDRGTVHLFAGGAIVADSDPIDEYEESLAKAAGMMAALRAGESTCPLAPAARNRTA